MSKYYNLAKYLLATNKDIVKLKFTEIESQKSRNGIVVFYENKIQ